MSVNFFHLDCLASEVRLNVDLIVVTSTAPANAVRTASSTIPTVFVAVSDPVEFGFIKSLAQPGGNMTGLANTNVELSAKRLEILREALPRIPELRRGAGGFTGAMALFLDADGFAFFNVFITDGAALLGQDGRDMGVPDDELLARLGLLAVADEDG